MKSCPVACMAVSFNFQKLCDRELLLGGAGPLRRDQLEDIVTNKLSDVCFLLLAGIQQQTCS